MNHDKSRKFMASMMNASASMAVQMSGDGAVKSSITWRLEPLSMAVCFVFMGALVQI